MKLADKKRVSYSGIFILVTVCGISFAFASMNMLIDYLKYSSHPNVVGSLRLIGIALESYYTDNSYYPLAVDEMGQLAIYSASGESYSTGNVPWVLTTPIPYLKTFFSDPYGPSSDFPNGFHYAVNPHDRYWILVSRGPDEDFDMIAEDYIFSASGDITRYLSHFGPGKAVEYDPTNGVGSSGDIFRTGP